MHLRRLQQAIQPIKHIPKDYIGMRLGGVEDHVGEYRHHLFKFGHIRQQRCIQLAHFWPKLHTCHAEFALEAFAQIVIQARLLGFI